MANFLDQFEKKPATNSTQPGQTAPAEKPQPNTVPDALEAADASTGVGITRHEVVIDSGYSKKKRTQFITALCLLLVLGAAIFFTIGLLNQVTVPNFVGKTAAEAKVWAVKNSVELDEQYEYNLSTSADIVLSQSAQSGSKIAKNTMLVLVISSGANPEELITVPNFESMTASEIQAWIDTNRLTNTRLSETYSDAVPLGGYISESFRDVSTGRENFKRKDYLTIYVSRGPETGSGNVTITNLVGKTLADAQTWADSSGLNITIVIVLSPTTTDKVLEQDIETGTVVETGAIIQLTVSGGKGIEVPDYSTISMSNAPTAHSAFSVTVSQAYSDTVPYGQYLSQSVAAGTPVLESDNKLTVVYSLGKPYLENLAGTSEKDLAAYFDAFRQSGANITYTITYKNASDTKGNVISTSRYNEFIEMDAVIEVVVSNGKYSSQKGASSGGGSGGGLSLSGGNSAGGNNAGGDSNANTDDTTPDNPPEGDGGGQNNNGTGDIPV